MGRDTVLFLDDKPERAALAYQRMTPAERDSTIWCRTAKEAIGVLKDYCERLSKVYLDHDLGGEDEDVPMHSGNEQSGMEVVRYLEDVDPDKFKDCLFIVHSWNAHAAKKMVERLIYAGYKSDYRPFGESKI